MYYDNTEIGIFTEQSLVWVVIEVLLQWKGRWLLMYMVFIARSI